MIREAEPASAGLVFAWMNTKAIWAVDNPDPYEPKNMEVFRPQWDRVVEQDSTWMVEIDDEPVGHLGWIPNPQHLAEFLLSLVR